MQLSNLFVLALATSISAADAAQDQLDSAQATGVTAYENVYYSGYSYEVPSLGRCWRLPETLARRVSSIRFARPGVSCALFSTGYCFPPALYSGLRQSVPDLHKLGLGDEVVSILCSAINNDEL